MNTEQKSCEAAEKQYHTTTSSTDIIKRNAYQLGYIAGFESGKAEGLESRQGDFDVLQEIVNHQDMHIASLSADVDRYQAKDWVSVNDKLPEFGGRYLCCVMDINDLGTSRFVWNCAYHEVEKRFSDRYLTDGETVTHWMELPAFPLTATGS